MTAAPAEIGLIFISYDGTTGLPLGMAIKSALKVQGVESWLWEEDHPDEYPWADIARQIKKADYICWVCTRGTSKSDGQAWEIENAFGQKKWRRSWVVATKRSFVPPVFAGYYHYPITIETAPDVVAQWVSRRRSRSGLPHVTLVAMDEAASSASSDDVAGSLEFSEITETAE